MRFREEIIMGGTAFGSNLLMYGDWFFAVLMGLVVAAFPFSVRVLYHAGRFVVPIIDSYFDEQGKRA